MDARRSLRRLFKQEVKVAWTGEVMVEMEVNGQTHYALYQCKEIGDS